MSFLRLIVATLILSPGFALAETTTLKSTLQLSWLGLGVAKLDSTVSVSDRNYAISGQMKTTGLVKAVTRSKGSFKTTGAIRGRQLVPSAYRLAYASGKKKGGAQFAYASGKLIEKVVTPKVKYKKGSVPVKADHLLNVLDPISASLFVVRDDEVGNGKAVCNRTLPVFDGKSRMNIVFKYKKSDTGAAKGFKGQVHTCSVRYKPVSGHRPFKKNVKFMKSNRDMEVTMARIGKSNVYGLFAFSIATRRGTASGQATRFAAQ